MASTHNDYGATSMFLASEARGGRALTSYPFFFHAIFAGLIPPFSTFFTAVLDHYRIQALHLHPNSVLVLSIFAFYCEAFLGVHPSVAFFRCFFSARRSAGTTGADALVFASVEASAICSLLWVLRRRSIIFLDAGCT